MFGSQLSAGDRSLGWRSLAALAIAVVTFGVGGCLKAFGSDPFVERPAALDYPAARKAVEQGRTVVLAVGVPAPRAIAGTTAARVAELPDTEPGVYVCWRAADGTPTFVRHLGPASAESVGRVLAAYRDPPVAPSPARFVPTWSPSVFQNFCPGGQCPDPRARRR